MINKSHNQSGFIALISVVIISFVLLLVAISLNMKSFYVRMNILDSENKKIADKLAEACIEHARLLLAVDKSANDSEVITGTAIVGDGVCDYKISTTSTINTHANSGNAHTYYEVTVNENMPEVPLIKFKELTIYP